VAAVIVLAAAMLLPSAIEFGGIHVEAQRAGVSAALRNASADGAAPAVGAADGLGAERTASLIFTVAPTGSDVNRGTAAEPFRTIQRAADAARPGDTVLIEDGTYTRPAEGTRCDSATSAPAVCLTR